MTEHEAAPKARLRFRDWLTIHAVLGFLFFAAGVAIYVVYARSLTNRFAVSARNDHVGLFVLTNLRMLPSYALIGVYHAALSFPLARALFRRRTRLPRFFVRLFHAFWMSIVVLLVSLGPLSYLSTGSIDLMARLAASASPRVDLYWFFDAHLREVFTALWAVFAGAAAWMVSRYVISALFALHGGNRVRWIAVAAVAILATQAILRTSRGEVHAVSGVSGDRHSPHVLIVASDSLRADHLGMHGYARNVSPNIDALAREAVDFEKCFVATASTIESWTSFLTGMYPANHGLRYMFVNKEQVAKVSNDETTLPRLLKARGYRTSVHGDWAANCFDVVDYGFETKRVSKSQNLDVFMAEIALRVHPLVPLYLASPWFEWLVPNLRQAVSAMAPDKIVGEFISEVEDCDRAGRPAFAVLFLACTHLPYMSPYPWSRRFVDPDYRGANRFRIDFDVDAFMQAGFPEAQSEQERQHVVDLYDGGVAWFDSIVGRITDRLRKDGILDDTILIVSSDHGDDLYEPGLTLGHGTNLFGGDQANRIPLLMRLPRAARGGTSVDAIVRGIDLKSTVLDLAGVPAPANDGVSLRPLIDGTAASLDLPAFAETCYVFFPKKPIVTRDNRSEVTSPADETLFIDRDFDNQLVLLPKWHDALIRSKDRMLRTERWKLVDVPGVNGPIFRLYDMSVDPHQQHDLSEDSLPVFTPLKARLQDWIATGRDSRWSASDDEPVSAHDR